jgi:hypothetical protein
MPPPMMQGDLRSQSGVALAPFLVDCPGLTTLGVRPSLECYSAAEKELLRNAVKVYFPTRRYLGLFQAVGKPTFPSAASYRYQHSQLLQQQLFRYLRWPSVPARIYYGDRQKRRIAADFDLPVEVCGRVNLDRQTTIAENLADLEASAHACNPVLIREARQWQRVIRCIAVNFRILGFQMLTKCGEWVPMDAFEQAAEPRERTLELITKADLDDIVVEWGRDQGEWLCLRLGRPPRRFRTCSGHLDRHRWISQEIRQGRL